MTAHAHDPAIRTDSDHPAPAAAGGTATNATAARPRWLMPGLLVVIAAGALVIAGVLPLSTVLYAGAIGGMLLMHLGGHGGHGGHGAHGGGRASPGESTPDTKNLSARSSGPRAPGSDSKGEPDDPASTDRSGNEADDHDQHSSRGCH